MLTIDKQTTDSLPPFVRHAIADMLRGVHVAHDRAEPETIAPHVANDVGSAEHSGDVFKALPTLAEWIGVDAAAALASRESVRVIENNDFELSVSIPLQEIIDGTWEKHREELAHMGTAAGRWRDAVLAEFLTRNPVAFDGRRLFDREHVVGTHPLYYYDNVMRADLRDIGVVDLVMQQKRVGADGRPIGAKVTDVVVPPALALMANAIRHIARVHVLPELAADDEWYALDCGGPVRPLGVQVRQDTTIRIVNAEWNVLIGVKVRGAAFSTFPALITRCKVKL